MKPRIERLRPTAVLPHRGLDQVEEFLRYEWLVDPGKPLVSMLHQTRAEGVMKDDPYRCRREEPWPCYHFSIGVEGLVHVPGAEPLAIEPPCPFRQRRRPRSVLLE